MLVKATVGILTAGVLGTGAWQIYTLVKPSTLGQKLSWEGFTLLSTDVKNKEIDKEEWKKLSDLYKKSENKWKIDESSSSVDNNDDQKI